MTGESNQDEQIESRDNMICKSTSSDNKSNPTQINYPQVVVPTLEEVIVSKVQSEVEIVMTSVKIRDQDAVLTAIETLVNPSIELAMNTTNAPSERSVDGNVLELDQREFLDEIEGFRETASERPHPRDR